MRSMISARATRLPGVVLQHQLVNPSLLSTLVGVKCASPERPKLAKVH